MARALYGCTSADFTLTAGGRLSPGAVLTLWTARTGGSRITDLLTVDGTPITEVVSGGDASIAYQGPDNDKSVHWADSGQGARTAIRPVDITGEAGPGSGILTTKGDLLVRSASADTRLPAAADGRFLTTDASQGVGVRWATPTTRVGTGSPLGIVTPDFKGQKFVDVDQTLGAREWVATGTTASSWVVSDGDTGWYTVPCARPAYWDSVGALRIRRSERLVTVVIRLTSTAGGTGFYGPLVNLPTAFRADEYTAKGLASLTSGGANYSLPVGTWGLETQLSLSTGDGLNTASSLAANAAVYAEINFAASAPWPTAAPV